MNAHYSCLFEISEVNILTALQGGEDRQLAALLNTNGIRKAWQLNGGEDFIVRFVNGLELMHEWYKELVTRPLL
jgi:hypothetical protein